MQGNTLYMCVGKEKKKKEGGGEGKEKEKRREKEEKEYRVVECSQSMCGEEGGRGERLNH